MGTNNPRMSVTVLQRCKEGPYGGFTNNSKVMLQIRLGEYGVISKILHKNISFIYKCSMPTIVRDELLRDVRTIRTILEKSEKEVIK